MTTYIFKTILCSGLLLLGYYLFLEREKTHLFNRVYLLFSIVFSFIIPLVSINIGSSVRMISEVVYQPNYILQNTVLEETLPSVQDKFNLANYLVLAYFSISVLLFCRLLINLFAIFYRIKNNSRVKYLDAKLVLTRDNRVPHSFLNYIFINKEDFERGTIEKEIFRHELAHIKQKHSADILFIEIIKIFAWVNPLLFMYRKAIQLNHEFLADEFVVNTGSSTQDYQLLLLNKTMLPSDLVLSSSFNYIQIKKRVIMMSKQKSLRIAILKQIALIPVIAAAGFLFTTKVLAQDEATIHNQQQIESSKTGVSQELLKEYQDIFNKYKKTLVDGKESYSLNLAQADKERVEKIFFQMSKEQQTKQMFVFVPANSMVLSRTIPTKEQFELFKDPKIYGIWINNQRVSNEVLNKYKNTDIAHVMMSKLAKNATNYGKHVYQVNLMTNDAYQKYYDETIAKKGYILTLNFIKKDESKREIVREDSSSSITTQIRMPRPDKTDKEWWQLVAFDRGFKYDSYTKYGNIVILGEKDINNNIESFKDLVALVSGKDNIGKGKDVIVIIHSETATFNTKNNELLFNNCKVEEWPLDSFHQEPLKSYTLKILGIGKSTELSKLAVR